MRRGLKRKKRIYIFMRLVFIIVIIIAALFFITDAKLRPLIKAAAASQAEAVAVKMINDTVSKILSEQGITYNDMVKLVYADDNSVTALESNVVIMNKMKTDINLAVAKAMEEYNTNALKIRIGTLTGNSFFMGRGPWLLLKIDLLNRVNSKMENVFTDAGINQTKHQIMLYLEVDLMVLIPWYNTNAKVKTDICLAETIIVGKVPDSYANIGFGDFTKKAP